MHVVDHKFKSLLRKILPLLAISLVLAGCQKSNKPAAQMAQPALNDISPAAASSKTEDLPAIIAFGDSLTAGYGLSEEQAYTTLLQRKLDEKNYRYRVVNAGVSGDTSAGGARRIDWALEGQVKFLILELGGNDALRGQPVTVMKNNLAQIIERAQSRGVTVVLAGMEAPPNLGPEYTKAYRQVFRDLANKYKLALVPFVLEGVGGRADLNQEDGIHPNVEGEKIMTENVWRVLEPLLNKQ